MAFRGLKPSHTKDASVTVILISYGTYAVDEVPGTF